MLITRYRDVDQENQYNMEEHSLFYLAIENVINNWAALQLAIQHGMGGSESAAKGQWLIGAVEQYFMQNDGLQRDEIEDFLTDTLNDEFDTIADDGSITEVANKFCHFHRLFSENREAMQIELESLPKLATEKKVIENDSTQLESKSNGLGVQETTQNVEEMEVETQEDEGWQTISRNKKKTAK